MSQIVKEPFSVLVVDDNQENLKVVSNVLKGEGYQIALAISAADAEEILKEHPINLILLDVMMPGTDGFTFCRKLKSDERFLEIPVIFLTAKTEISDLVEGFSVGGLDYVAKPFQKEELLVRVRTHLTLAHAKQQIRQQAEEIKRINLTKDRMYAVIAHDIKSPFSNIAMLISALAEGYISPGTPEYEEILQDINKSTTETYSLLENLLQWTRTQTRELEVSPETIELHQLVKKVCSFHEVQSQQKNISLNQDVPEDFKVHADPVMLQSILQNLIGNALKFTHPEGRIDIAAIQVNNQVEICIKDTGVGMAEETIDNLFSDKGQVTTRGTGDEKGSGLGLLLVKEFINKINGNIEVESKLNEGSTFTLTLPSI